MSDDGHRDAGEGDADQIGEDEAPVAHAQKICPQRPAVASAARQRDGYEERYAYRPPSFHIGMDAALRSQDDFFPEPANQRDLLEDEDDVVYEGIEQNAKDHIRGYAYREGHRPGQAHPVHVETKRQAEPAFEHPHGDRCPQFEGGDEGDYK